MKVIVTAGGETDSKNPLYETARGGLKSMIEVQGKPMVQWVLDALSASQTVDHVIVVGLPPETDLVCRHPLTLLSNTGARVNNIQAGIKEIQRIDPQAEFTLLVASDIPALRGEMVDWFIEHIQGQDQDIFFTVVERNVMEAGFPGLKTTYTHLKEFELCAGNLHGFRIKIANDETALWKKLAESLDKPLRQASVLGYDTMLFLMLHRLSLEDAEAAVSKRLGVHGKAVLCPYPEIGMNVDKPAQLELVREHFAKHHEQYAA